MNSCAPLRGRRSLILLFLLGCGGEDAKFPPPPPPPGRAVVDAGGAPPTIANSDPLGNRPDLGDPAPFTPPVPTQYKRDGGLTVWLLERHTLPIVSMQVVVPAGASSDPPDKGGLAYTTANMLDEGAGTRGPLEISRDIDRLGATLKTGAYSDYAYVHLTVLKKNMMAAAAIFGDVVAKPTMSPVEFKRVHDLWENSLKQRQSEPNEVANVVITRKLFPPGHPYAHPTEGTLPSAAKVTLEEVKKFYGTQWRPDRATLVITGDVTKQEADALIDQALSAWKAPATPPPPADPLPRAPSTSRGDTPLIGQKVYVVDRTDAPQSVIALARPGVAASEEDAAGLVRINGALGGSFTSRLNQDLREEHGWSYGARSRFTFTKMKGSFIASAAVHTEHTGDALKAMIADVDGMAKSGLTDEEVDKTKKLARADLVEAFEGVANATNRLARNAGAGLSPDHEANKAKLTAHADKDTLKRLAASYIDPKDSIIVIVGPRAKIEPQLKAIGITAIESTGPEGQ